MSLIVADRCDFNPGDTIDGRYRIERPLGEGTFGVVYKVADPSGHVFALKLLKLWTVTPDVCKGLRDRFVMEFETGQIRSDHLAHSYTYGEVGGNPYILMEFCPGGDLRRYAASRSFDVNRAGGQILAGLRDLHACGKVHRDLKPENVLIREDGTAVLTDFGISGDRNKRMTERGWLGKPSQLFGTYPYMPPEQVNPPRGGNATVLPTTDLFSFGVMMYEILVGELPFGELTEATLPRYLENAKAGRWDRSRLRIVASESPWPEIIEGCLVPDFKSRTQSAGDILSRLPSGGAPRRNIPDHPFLTVRTGILLRVMQGEEYGREYRLEDLRQGRCILTVGRDTISVHNRIPLKEECSCYISRHHCTLETDGTPGSWIIRDGQWVADTARWEESLNGTYVNSSEVDMRGMRIRPGDIISIGDVKLRVEGY
ncbi:MAG: protein kinase [Bacteroidales bacterium]|nr:protein kinase [Bacteroidales bacterium]